jgi:hypothetical protein
MQHTYGAGNMNGSLFATEGVASVAVLWAPISAFIICGLVVALANRLSAGLPSRFVLISSALFPLILSNVSSDCGSAHAWRGRNLPALVCDAARFFSSAMPLKPAHALPAAGSAA